MADVNLPTSTDTVQTPETVATPDRWLRPPADVAETDQGLELWLDLPGVAKDAVKLEVDGLELRIRAPRDALVGYRRTFTLPRQVDPAGITAKMDAGVLHLALPRAEAFTRRVIDIG